MIRRWILLGVLLGLAACGAPPDESRTDPGPRLEATVAEGEVRVGEPAPLFRLQASDGRILDLAELKGKAVVVNFWATWCGPCKTEMPELQAAYEANREAGLEIIGVEIQASGSPDESAAFLRDIGATFPTARDEQGRMEAVYVRRPAWPTTVFIDREGIVHFVQIGPMTREFIEEQLAGLGF